MHPIPTASRTNRLLTVDNRRTTVHKKDPACRRIPGAPPWITPPNAQPAPHHHSNTDPSPLNIGILATQPGITCPNLKVRARHTGRQNKPDTSPMVQAVRRRPTSQGSPGISQPGRHKPAGAGAEDGREPHQGRGPAPKALRGLTLWFRTVMTTVTDGEDRHQVPAALRDPSNGTSRTNSPQKPRKIRVKPLVFHMKNGRLEIESHPDKRNRIRYETED